MIRSIVPAVALALAVSGAGAAARHQQVFRGGTDLVQLNVTVLNANQHFVGGLTRDDFQVFEDGVPQDISLFSSDRQPIALSILVDSSTSMETKLAVAQEAAVGFARRLGDRDLAEVIEFNSHERIVQGFTNDRGALETAIRRTSAGGSTSLYNAIYIALRDLARTPESAPGALRRQAIVVLSDGEDTSSLKTYDDVLDESKRAEAVIYAIGLRSKDELTPRHGFSEGDFVMRSFAQETRKPSNRRDGKARARSQPRVSRRTPSRSSRVPRSSPSWAAAAWASSTSLDRSGSTAFAP